MKRKRMGDVEFARLLRMAREGKAFPNETCAFAEEARRTRESEDELLELARVVYECERSGQVWPEGCFGRLSEALARAAEARS